MWNAQGSGGSYPNQWALNPAAYANTPNEQVDWASLAQQWIKMKETMGESAAEALMSSAATSTQAPLQAAQTAAAVPDTGGGLAVGAQVWQDPASGGAVAGWWEGCAPTGSAPQAWNATTASSASSSSWFQEAAPPPPPPPPSVPSYSYQPTPPPPPHYSNNSQGYWSGGGGSKEWGGSNSGSQTQRSHGGGRRGTNSAAFHQSHYQGDAQPSTPHLDASKRKQLPAWIRDGLEKMEREKLKRAEQERLNRENLDESQRRGDTLGLGDIPTFPLRDNVNGSPPSTSHTQQYSNHNHKVESESDSDRSEERDPSPPPPDDRRSPTPPPPQPLTKEEIFQNVMMGVRRILTQLLMEVTGEEVRKIAESVVKKHKRKASATSVNKTMALSSLTGKLGLGIYGSDSDSDSHDSPDEESEYEIRARIRRKQEEFESKELEIEREVEELEEREKRVLMMGSKTREESPEATGASTSVQHQSSPDEPAAPLTPPLAYQQCRAKARRTENQEKVKEKRRRKIQNDEALQSDVADLNENPAHRKGVRENIERIQAPRVHRPQAHLPNLAGILGVAGTGGDVAFQNIAVGDDAQVGVHLHPQALRLGDIGGGLLAQGIAGITIIVDNLCLFDAILPLCSSLVKSCSFVFVILL